MFRSLHNTTTNASALTRQAIRPYAFEGEWGAVSSSLFGGNLGFASKPCRMHAVALSLRPILDRSTQQEGQP